jgi:hypothetical protein
MNAPFACLIVWLVDSPGVGWCVGFPPGSHTLCWLATSNSYGVLMSPPASSWLSCCLAKLKLAERWYQLTFAEVSHFPFVIEMIPLSKYQWMDSTLLEEFLTLLFSNMNLIDDLLVKLELGSTWFRRARVNLVHALKVCVVVSLSVAVLIQIVITILLLMLHYLTNNIYW